MLPYHHSIYTCRIFEGEESKTARAACSIAHNGARIDFAKLGKIIPQGFYKETSFSPTSKERV